jgi:hypothetical protein
MNTTICVFCASSEDLNETYYDLASKLGELIGKNSINLVYGAGGIGLMGRLAESAAKFGSKIIGVIPEVLNKKGIVREKHHQLIVTPDMKSRKDEMRNLSDAFIALPGGFGTIEELLEIITLKQLKYHSKPIVVINHNNFFNPMLEQFELFYKQGFAHPNYKKLFFVTNSLNEGIEYINNYKHENIYDKYLKY